MKKEIGEIISQDELQEFEHLTTYNIYEIYLLNDDTSFIIAIDNTNLICSRFEFCETEDGLQLAHMYTLPILKNQGIGKEIMKQAVELWTNFKLPSTNTNDTYYFIESGLRFIKSCFRDGILKQPPFKYPE